VLPGSGVPVLLPDEVLAYEAPGYARDLKAHVRERFDTIDRTLAEPYATFATFLNLGYVPDDNPQHAVRGPARPAFNRFSTTLLFEVIGGCNLDGRATIELGCGRGGNVAMIQRYYAPRTLVGLDLSTANAEFCQARHRLESGGFAVGDVELLPFRDGSADVVLNLESSHYYPHIERFFDEVHRVLARGGELLYADILPAETFDAARRHLSGLGLTLLRDQDIGSNVLRSCEAIAAIREKQQHTGLYDTFLVVPGSAEFEALRTARTQYRILTLRKPE
jgi:SAM-dependent methyltransferase